MNIASNSSKQADGAFDYCNICGLPGISCHTYHSLVPPNLPPDGNSRIHALECGCSNCHKSLEKEDGVPLGFDHDARYSKVFAAQSNSSLRIKGGLAKGPILKGMSYRRAKSNRNKKIHAKAEKMIKTLIPVGAGPAEKRFDPKDMKKVIGFILPHLLSSHCPHCISILDTTPWRSWTCRANSDKLVPTREAQDYRSPA